MLGSEVVDAGAAVALSSLSAILDDFTPIDPAPTDSRPDGRRWTCFRSGKVCAITYARIQGKQAMIQRFQNSSLLAESLEVQPRLFVSHGPEKGKPERFPGGAELPVELPPPVVEPPARRARNRRAR